MDSKNLHNCPLKLNYTRIHRKYTGGLLLEKWQGKPDAKDGNMPEEWVASTVEARTPEQIENEGLSLVKFGEEKGEFLRNIIKSDPTAFLGKDHVQKYGENTAVLLKIIDSCKRLYLQVHPDRAYAKRVFDSDFGKTEAWYILGSRFLDGQEPYILLGFKKGITKEIWRELFEKQDIRGMENALHRFVIKPGDIFFIESGMPHALGTGCFLAEVQEPTDYTMRVERTTPEGDPLPDSFCHQDTGFENMLDCFRYDTYTREEILDKWYLEPSVIETQRGGTRTSIISTQYTPYFSMEKLSISGDFIYKKEDSFAIAVVISGKGKIVWNDGEVEVNQADELFLPYGLKQLTWSAASDENLEVILCYPPK